MELHGLWLIFRSKQRKKKRLEREKQEKWEDQRKINVNASKVFEEMGPRDRTLIGIRRIWAGKGDYLHLSALQRN